MSGGVEWALHCCVVLTASSRPVPAARLAELHDVSGSYLAKQLQSLARAGLIHSVQGKSGGYALTRAAGEHQPARRGPGRRRPRPGLRLHRDPPARPPRPARPSACTQACPIARAMWAAEKAWRQALAEVTIADLARDVDVDSGPEALAGVSAWLTGQADG